MSSGVEEGAPPSKREAEKEDGAAERMLQDVAKSGRVPVDWGVLLEVLTGKLAQVLQRYQSTYGPCESETDEVSFAERRNMLTEALRSFDGPPFTVQRLAEVLLNPEPQYAATHKLMNGLEKLLSVSSTLQSIGDAEDEAADDMIGL